MKSSRGLRAKLKPWMLPIAIVCGLIFHEPIRYLQPLSPVLIVVMLYITFCRLHRSDFHVGSYMIWLLLAQFGGSVVAYALLKPFGEDLAQGAMICVICPTATAAPVITGMLGGSVARVAAYSLFSNVGVAFAVPPLLSWINPGADVAFADTLWRICRTVMPLIFLPLILAGLTYKLSPRLHAEVASRQSVSFYIWALALLIVVGNAVSFVMKEPADRLWVMVGLAAVSLLLCIVQFALGRFIGRRCGDVISASQSLGQKNTVLAIWIATTYLNPIVSVAPAAYILWHNSVNSIQLYLHQRKMENLID